MSSGIRILGCVAALAAFAAFGAAGCDDRGQVRLITVFPQDDPDLLDNPDARVMQIGLDLYAADDPGGAPVKSVVLARREALRLGNLGAGPWTIAMRGLDGDGKEVVYGKTEPFRIKAGEVTDVSIFLGRAHAFNLVGLSPQATASAVDGLMSHTATPFKDEDGKEWILVAGGFHSGEGASAEAYLIDPNALTVEKLGAEMERPHLGHTAIAVEPPGRAPVVVIADGAPVTSLEVYDTADRLFRTIDVPCGPASFSGIAAALTPDEHGALVPSGRVILPGAELCVVDPYGERAAETWPSPTGAQPTAPAVSAANAAGQLVVVDAAGVVWSTSAIERSAGANPCDGAAVTVFESLTPRAGASLVAVGAADRFALVGGETPLGGVPENDWAIIGLEGCDISSAKEGSSGAAETRLSPVLLDLSGTGDAEPALDLLVTGGSKRADSDLLVADGTESIPLLYEAMGEHTPAMHAARQNHAIAVLSNRSAWVIGGGGDSNAEIFELGSATEKLGATEDEFALRRPVLTAMTVLDQMGATDGLTTLIENSFLTMLFSDEITSRMSATVGLFGSSNRGIGDGLDQVEMPDNGYCTENAVSEESPIIWGGVVGDNTAGIDFPEGVNPTENNSEAIESSKEAITNAMSGVKAELVARGGGDPGAARALRSPVTESTTCQWRQYTRVGFDGLGWEGSHKDATYSGVNLLVWVVTGDDCSQGVYGTTNVDALPPEETLATTTCDDTSMDRYFGLPPSGIAQWLELQRVVEGLVWDMQDLIIAVVAKDDGSGTLPRRLGETTDFMVDNMGAELVPMLVASTDDETDFAGKLATLSERVFARNPYQVCVPPEVAGDSVAPYNANTGGDTGLFMPIGTDNPWAESMLAAVTEDVATDCRVLRVRPADAEGATTGVDHVRIEDVPGTWRVATDTDRRGGCALGWTIQLDSFSVSEGDALFLQCTPG
jgi:hypothetical protein